MRLRVTDPGGLQGTTSVTVTAGAPPTAQIVTPAAGAQFTVGEEIQFSGSAKDWQGADIPASGLSWKLTLEHCWDGDPQNCHSHPLLTFAGPGASSWRPTTSTRRTSCSS